MDSVSRNQPILVLPPGISSLTIKQAAIFTFLVLAICILLLKLFQKRRDPRQPRPVPAIIPIPFIGHALGLLIWRNHYYTKVVQRWNLPIVALPMFGGHVYVIKSPDFIFSIQRQPKSLSFWHFEGNFTVKLGSLSKSAAKDSLQGLEPGSDEPCLVIDILRTMKIALTPQSDLQRMSNVAAGVMHQNLGRLRAEGRRQVDLFEWAQHEIVIATTEAIYGEHNPWRDPEVENGFWDFASSLMIISLPGILPRIFAPRGFAGHQKVVQALMRYYESGAHLNSSALTLARWRGVKNLMSTEDVARCESTNGLAIIANSAPVSFWVIFHIFSDPALLAQVREKVDADLTTETTTADGARIRTVDLSKSKDIRLLSSIIQETVRFRARGTGPRMAMEDITIADNEREYRIEKGSVVMIPHEGLHYDKATWGETADKFVAERFLPGNKIPNSAYRGFGGGANMCPGKGFAIAEISALVVLLAAMFDLNPVDGQWQEPGLDDSNMAREHNGPIKKVLVDILPRKDIQDVQLDFVY